jgi:hypothetical protein
MGISGSDAGVSVCGRAQLHLCQRFRVEDAAVGLRHPTIRDGDRHQGRRAPQTCSTRLSLAFYFCRAIVEEKEHFISSKPAGRPAAPLRAGSRLPS